jgi:hypothetical protein
MSERLKTVSRIAQLIDHQKEIIEMQYRQIQKKMDQEQNLLAALENQLVQTICSFEEDMQDRSILTNQDMAYLYGISSFLSKKIEAKTDLVVTIGKELRAQEVLWREAFRKKKAFDLLKDKIVFTEKVDEQRIEQKSQDYLSLVSGQRK